VTASDRDHLGTLRAIMSEWLRAIIGIRTATAFSACARTRGLQHEGNSTY
jgi:hypothetical protein